MGDRITTQEAAARLNFSVTHVHRLITGSGGCRKRLDAIKNARGDYLIDEASVTRFQLERGPWRSRPAFHPDYVMIQEACERVGMERNALMLALLTTDGGSALEWFGDTPMIHERHVQHIERSMKGS